MSFHGIQFLFYAANIIIKIGKPIVKSKFFRFNQFLPHPLPHHLEANHPRGYRHIQRIDVSRHGNHQVTVEAGDIGLQCRHFARHRRRVPLFSRQEPLGAETAERRFVATEVL
jgi:hypothetical protein